MAKRKLSAQQRQIVRKEIRQMVAQKKTQADILRAVSGKYHITPVTARWYYKSVSGPGRRSKLQKVKSRKVRDRAHPSIGTLRIVYQVQSVAERRLNQALKAKKLIPQWQNYVKKEASLRKLEDKVKTELRQVSSKATALHRKIRSLTSG